MVRSDDGYRISNENRMTKLESKVDSLGDKVDNLAIASNSLEEKVDKLNLTVSRWMGAGAVILFIGNAVLAYILSR